MNLNCRFILIDENEPNSFVSCKAIMLASRETIIQTFTDVDGALTYISEKRVLNPPDRTILFVSNDLSDDKTERFLQQYAAIDESRKSLMELYILKKNTSVNIAQNTFDFIKGEVDSPLSIQSVAECMINFS